MTLHVNNLIWPVKRTPHAFRAFVVRTPSFDPLNHRSIFDAVCLMFAGVPPRIEVSASSEHDRSTSCTSVKSRHHFDLVTFPEAFLMKYHYIAAPKAGVASRT